jgi:glutaredoxin 2
MEENMTLSLHDIHLFPLSCCCAALTLVAGIKYPCRVRNYRGKYGHPE